MPKRWTLGVVLAVLALLIPAASFAGDDPPATPNAVNTADDVLDVTQYLNKNDLPFVGSDVASSQETFSLDRARTPSRPTRRNAARRPFDHDPQVGELRNWAGLDNVRGVFYVKQYQLRGIGEHVEVWVAEGLQGPAGAPPSNDTEFLPGDCRNDRTAITDEQVQYLINEFDTNIYPKESAAFSAKPDRNGSRSTLPRTTFHPEGEGDNVVVLVDNVRDENFYDFNNEHGFTYIAGFYSSQLDNLFDRTIMSIDAFDWLHRTGANPPHEPVPGDNCRSAPARPFLYEGVFAHEYEHLLMQYEDSDEVNWVDEGLADWAQTLTGYVNPATPITEIGFDSHVQCFLGWLGVRTEANPNPREGGPENSLTLWEDQGDDEVLCDYGAAYTFMELLAGRYGQPFMSALHREDANGLAGLQAVLNQQAGGLSTMEVLRDWAAAVALDGVLDDGANLLGGSRSRYRVPTLDASINWNTPETYSTPGAPPNGSDYVRLRDAQGRFLSVSQIRSIEFDGAETLAPRQPEWTVDSNPPMHEGDPALYSGTGPNLDRAIVRSVSVPAGNATLTFESLWNLELGWDFGVVQVSTDGGATYRSISCTDTTSEHDPGAIARIVAELPGFTGYSEGWRDEECDLGPYAGQTILISFRLLTDPLVEGQVEDVPPGWWVDDVAVGGEVVSDGSSLDGWQTPSQVRPTPVPGWTVQLISYSTTYVFGRPLFPAHIYRLRLDRNFEDDLNRLEVLARLGLFPDVVAAIVTAEDPEERLTEYPCYTLTVNGVTQPGGC
jgi:hypothetical protein